MNVRPGDLAVFVAPHVDANLGRFVTVIEPLGSLAKGDEFYRAGRRFRVSSDGFFWWIEGASALTAMRADEVIHVATGFAADHALRPIRDPGDDARDETLEWLDVPHKETA